MYYSHQQILKSILIINNKKKNVYLLASNAYYSVKLAKLAIYLSVNVNYLAGFF